MRAGVIAIVLLAGAAALTGCSGEDSTGSGAPPGFPVTVQSCDREVTFEEPPERVLTQGSESVTLVAAAGAADRIVARNSEFGSPLGQYAQELESIPKIGGDASTDLSLEAIIAQNPDLVVQRGTTDDLPVDVLAEVGINTYVVSGRCISNDSGIQADGTYDLFYADIERFGRVFNTEDTAAAAVNELRERVTAVERSFAQTPSRSAVAVIFFDGAIGSYGNQATIDTQMASLGLRNIFGDQDERYFEPNVEELIARDPDVLIIVNLDETAEEARREVMSRPRLAGLRAVREGRVASLQFGLITESPLAVEGLEQLAGQLRP